VTDATTTPHDHLTEPETGQPQSQQHPQKQQTHTHSQQHTSNQGKNVIPQMLPIVEPSFEPSPPHFVLLS
jgi:hypothetical protein